jgi:hypothetical protein
MRTARQNLDQIIEQLRTHYRRWHPSVAPEAAKRISAFHGNFRNAPDQ